MQRHHSKKFQSNGWPSYLLLKYKSDRVLLSLANTKWCASSNQISWWNKPIIPNKENKTKTNILRGFFNYSILWGLIEET